MTPRVGIIAYVDWKLFNAGRKKSIQGTYNMTIHVLVVETMTILLVIKLIEIDFRNGNTWGSNNFHLLGAVMFS